MAQGTSSSLVLLLALVVLLCHCATLGLATSLVGDEVNWKWEFVTYPGPTPMFGQICQTYTNGTTQHDQLLVYAGYHASPQGPSNSMYRYDFVTGQKFGITQHAPPGGSIPWKRDGATAIMNPSKTKMMIFGGSQAPAEALDDTWELDIATFTWTEYTAGVHDGPSRRYGSSIVYVPEMNCALMFAGSFWLERLYYNDLWCYRFDTHTWRPVHPGFGSSPAPRFGHTAAYFEGLMYIYGGGDGSGDFNEVWAFSIENQQWGVVLSKPPPGRAWMQSAVVNKHWVVVGGARNSTDNM
ncbi:uncharacterized protein LOC135811379 isoform X2 [Sycon ciliatum]|uniref:uncharacterized protein LOC135811379 isoform X2 n=1 Tax=Sycon ciliatum TaxID=27933 RepID=UPI0031F62669